MKKLILILIVLFLTQPVLALEQSFQTGAYEDNIELCLCEEVIDTIFVHNTAPFHTTFTVTNNLDDTEITGLLLAPGARTDVQLPLRASCDEEEEVIEYEVYVKSEYTGEKVIKRTLERVRCESMITTLEGPESVNPCEPLEYNIHIENIAPYTENYYIRPLTYQNYFNSNLYYVQLQPGQKGIINAELQLACELYGVKEIKFEVESINNQLKQEITQNLTVNRAYGFEVETEVEEYYCAEETTKIPITITNQAAFHNTYEITLENAPRGASLDTKTITVEAQEQNTTFITLYGTGDFEFNVTVISEKGELEAVKTLNVKRDFCYEYEITIPFNKVCEDTIQNIHVENKGIKDNPTILEVEGAVYNNNLTLPPKETTEIPLYFGEAGVKDLTIKLLINDRIEKIEEKSINVLTSRECIEPSITRNARTRYYHDYFVLNIRNEGIQETEYNLSINELNFSKIINLESNEQKDFEVPQNYTKEDIGSKEYNILIQANNQTYESTLTLRILDEPLLIRLDNTIRENNCETFTIILIIILIISLLTLIKKINDKNYKKGINKKKILAGILIPVVIVVTLFVYGVPEIQRTGIYEENETLTISFFSDENKTIDLNEFFIDPDQGELEYLIGWAPTIDYKIEENILTLIPEGYVGKTEFSIIAIDDFNDTTESPMIEIIVKERKEYNLKNLCHLIIMLLLILILTTYLFTRIKK